MSSIKLQPSRGTRDLIGEEFHQHHRVIKTARRISALYGFEEWATPIFEDTRVFSRGLGETSDVVSKEMYVFDDRGGESMTLRPENTAGVCRALVSNGLTQALPRKVFYAGPMFRYERPQKGRYRQFHQVGVEALGYEGPDVDAEHILMCARLWDDLGLEDVQLEINSLGSSEERAAHRAALITYLEGHKDSLDEDGQRRLYTNPLRILDTKNPAMQEMCSAAPKLIDYLGTESLTHFEGVQRVLRDAGIPFKINPRLVRGLDYYNLTVFEWVTDKLGAQGTVCAGGRYDGLVEQLGGKPTPACGFAMGIERLIALIKDAGGEPMAPAPDVYLVHQGDGLSGCRRLA